MGIDNCSGVWFKGLRAPWTTSFNNNFSLSTLGCIIDEYTRLFGTQET